MSRVIKRRTATAHVTAFGPAAALPPPETLRPDPNVAIIAALEDRLADLEQALVRQAEDATAAAKRARDAGYEAGLAEVVDREDERIATLSAGIAAAHDRLDDKLDVIEGLAPLLARSALERLMEPDAALGDRAAAMVSCQMRALRDAVVQTVRVSRTDYVTFSAHPACAAIPAGVELVADDMLRSGDCSIALQLGTIDLSAREQWDAVIDALTTMAMTGA